MTWIPDCAVSRENMSSTFPTRSNTKLAILDLERRGVVLPT